MNIVITASPGIAETFSLPISFIFWGFVIVYTIHILEEAVLGETFVAKVKNHIWPDYSWHKFLASHPAYKP
jgi:hypothetical protein